jgi:hypothetical protein
LLDRCPAGQKINIYMSKPIVLPPIPITINKRSNQFFRTYLNLMIAATGNKLAEQEQEVLEECFIYGRGEFDTDTRRTICERLKISEANLNNYIRKLRLKQYIDNENRMNKKLNISMLRIPEGMEEVSATIIFTISNKSFINLPNIAVVN